MAGLVLVAILASAWLRHVLYDHVDSESGAWWSAAVLAVIPVATIGGTFLVTKRWPTRDRTTSKPAVAVALGGAVVLIASIGALGLKRGEMLGRFDSLSIATRAARTALSTQPLATEAHILRRHGRKYRRARTVSLDGSEDAPARSAPRRGRWFSLRD